MNLKLLLLAFSASAIASCNTAYKSGQTPDDVYFSPTRVIEEDNRKVEDEQVYTTTTESIEEREIRMKVRDRRWRDLNNDYDCNCSCDYHPYKYGYSYGYYYNPYYYPYPVYLPGTRSVNPKNTAVRTGNLSGYNTVTTTQVVNPKTGVSETIRRERTYNNNNSSSRREVFTPSNNNRTYSPSNKSSSGSGNSGSGRSVSRPARN